MYRRKNISHSLISVDSLLYHLMIFVEIYKLIWIAITYLINYAIPLHDSLINFDTNIIYYCVRAE